ncbi:MAG: hypothetical protein ABH840_00160 [Nanoarchaeota archaeon]
MSQRLLVTRPEHDDTTTYLSHYAKLVIKYAKEKGVFVTDFKPGTVKKEAISKFIKKQNPKLLFLNGHGNEDCIEGEKEEIIIKENENDELLKNKITYARSCFVAVSLGKKCSTFGKGTCFIGYEFPFQFWFDETRTANPIKDKIASLYLEPSNELVKYLIKGNFTKTAFDKSKELMVKNMNKILKENEPGALERFKSLWMNHEGQRIYGDKEIFF